MRLIEVKHERADRVEQVGENDEGLSSCDGRHLASEQSVALNVVFRR